MGLILLSTKFVRLYFGANIDNLGELPGQLQIVYLLLLVTSVFVVIFKPKQDDQELAEEKIDHLSDRIDAKDHEVQDALALKAEFIRNVNHEYRTPITGVMSMAEALQSAYKTLNEDERQQAIDVIVESSRRLKEYDDNITTLARLNKANYKLEKEEFNLSNLVYTRIDACKKLYETKNKEDREFLLEIEEDVMFNGARDYISQLLDNLIINAIKYCAKGKINIRLVRSSGKIKLSIEDEGIGIPQNELQEIFEPFVVSSRTRSNAGGRGVGLAACKRIVEVHNGTIRAQSFEGKGAVFTVDL